MNDKKLIASIIKNLERTIGILENCGETGEMSEATRRRMVEMLNSSTLDIYFFKSTSVNTTLEDPKEALLEVPSLTKNPASNIPVEEFVEQKHELALAPDVHEEPNVSPLHEVVEEINEIEAEQFLETPLPYSEEIVSEDKDVTASFVTEPEALLEEVEEKVSSKYESIFELEQEPISTYVEEEIIEERENQEENELIETEKEKLEEIRFQLEQERLRLETELQNWNLEKQKREEEMRAAERLLAALAKEQEKRNEQIENQKTARTFDIPDYNLEQQEAIISKKAETPVKKQTPPKKEPAPKVQEKKTTEENLINNFLGNNKKFLHESFEMDDINVQGLAPVSDLSRVIGINDKFQFIKELFGGDSDLYMETISKLNSIGSYDAGLSYLFSNFQWDKSNVTVKRILTLLKRRYM